MRATPKALCWSILGFLLCCWATATEPEVTGERGDISGRVTDKSGSGVPEVEVRVVGSSLVATTDLEGVFELQEVPAGGHTLHFLYLDRSLGSKDVVVEVGKTVRVDVSLEASSSFFESMTVYSASRREESITEAPGAVTVVVAESIRLGAADGQLPKLLEFTTGAHSAQSALYDFNFNTRGFNDLLNSRVEVRLDGRDVSNALFGFQEWSAISFPLDDLRRIEMLRGPSSALYGANAWGGVMYLESEEPRSSQGGQARITLGELDTVHGDLRWAGELGAGWFAKVVGGLRRSEDFTRVRSQSAEYSTLCPPGLPPAGCLPREVPRRGNGPRIGLGGVRFDKYFGDERMLTLEAGVSDAEGQIVQTGGGRQEILGVERPWSRVAFRAQRWRAMAAYDEGRAETLNLSSGAQDSFEFARFQARIQGGRELRSTAIHLAGGAFFDRIDTGGRVDPATGETVDEVSGALYGQAAWTPGQRFKLVAALRWEDSSIYDSRVSPKAAAIYRPSPRHTVRLTYNEAFRSSSLFGLFLSSDVAPPADLSGIEATLCAPAGIDCGLGEPVPVLGVGNSNLVVEENRTVELGYLGTLGGRALVSLDVYYSRIDNFLSQNLLPQLGTSLGRLNEDFGPWQAPQGIPESTRDAIRELVPLLSNRYDGAPIVAAFSFTNLGEVEAWGIELGLDYRWDNQWSFRASYSYFDSEVVDPVEDLESVFTPNTPEHAASLGVNYSRSRFDARLQGRWVDRFPWVSGVFRGTVESYTVVDADASYALGRSWIVGAQLANLLDEEHYEAFGGNLLGRRALVYLNFLWR